LETRQEGLTFYRANLYADSDSLMSRDLFQTSDMVSADVVAWTLISSGFMNIRILHHI